MIHKPNDTDTEDHIKALLNGAEQVSRLGALHADGSLGRWAASQAAIANYHVPHVAHARTFWGGMMEVDIRETVSAEIFIHGMFEPELSAFFQRHLKRGQTFVDVGAHIGYFSLLASQLVGEEGRVAAIEPSERTSWRLIRNLSGSRQAKVHRVAAWNKEALLNLMDYGPLYSAFNSIGDRRIHESSPNVKGTPFEVRAVALDEFFAEINLVPDVIKIDAESAEIQVLEGLAGTLREVRPILTLEVGDYSHLLEKGIPSSAEVLQIVMKYGYVCYNANMDGLDKHDLKQGGSYEYSNIVAIPSERQYEFES